MHYVFQFYYSFITHYKYASLHLPEVELIG